MFEGFPDSPSWGEEDSLPPPELPEWWENLFVICGLGGLVAGLIKLIVYGV